MEIGSVEAKSKGRLLEIVILKFLDLKGFRTGVCTRAATGGNMDTVGSGFLIKRLIGS